MRYAKYLNTINKLTELPNRSFIHLKLVQYGSYFWFSGGLNRTKICQDKMCVLVKTSVFGLVKMVFNILTDLLKLISSMTSKIKYR